MTEREREIVVEIIAAALVQNKMLVEILLFRLELAEEAANRSQHRRL